MTERLVVYENEANALSRYLVGKNCSSKIAEDFAEAIVKLDVQLTASQERTYLKMLRSIFFMRAVDGGLAFTNKQSLLRKRIFIMLCLLECTVEFNPYFLPISRSPFYFVKIGLEVAYNFLAAIIGIIIVKIFSIE
jgi:hypothetical protein